MVALPDRRQRFGDQADGIERLCDGVVEIAGDAIALAQDGRRLRLGFLLPVLDRQRHLAAQQVGQLQFHRGELGGRGVVEEHAAIGQVICIEQGHGQHRRVWCACASRRRF